MTVKIDGQEYPMRAYSTLFYSKLCNSRACFTCPYASVERNCDITLGDFWSIQRFKKGYEEGKGVSKLLAHTEKGDSLIRQCAAEGKLTELAFDPGKDTPAHALTCPYKKPVEYELFWKDFQRLGFSALEKKYTGERLPDRIRRMIRRRLLGILARQGRGTD